MSSDLVRRRRRIHDGWDSKRRTTEIDRKRCRAFGELLAALEAAEERAEAAESALGPFARFMEVADGPTRVFYGHGKSEIGPGLFADTGDDYVVLRPSPEIPALTLGHLRRARRVLVACHDEKREEDGDPCPPPGDST